ncbi:hypothetical protein [Microtetraspora sp. AC03309]|nr:hypothetical protein [Microtetraspora sp. AC03309]
MYDLMLRLHLTVAEMMANRRRPDTMPTAAVDAPAAAPHDCDHTT